MVGLFGRDGLQHRTDFIAFQVIHRADWSTLNGNSQGALGFFVRFRQACMTPPARD